MDRQQQLKSRLREWVASEAANGEAVPSSELVERIADEAAIPVDAGEPALDRWRGTIQSIIDEVSSHVSELTHALGGDSGADEGTDRLAALIAWRDAAEGQEAIDPGDVTDAHLRTVVKFADRSDQLARRLPPVVFALVPEMLAVLGLGEAEEKATESPEADPFSAGEPEYYEQTQDGGLSFEDGHALSGPPAYDTEFFAADEAADEVVPLLEEEFHFDDEPVVRESPVETYASDVEPGTSNEAPIPPPDEPDEVVDRLDRSRGWPVYDGPPPATDLDRMRESVTDDGIRLQWAAPSVDSAVTVYRVIAEDHYRPYSPDSARTIAITEELSCVDAEPLVTPLRYVQVWCHRGETYADANQSQPVAIAETVIVTPPQDIMLAEDEGKVVGQWRTLHTDSTGERRVVGVRVTRYREGHPAGRGPAAAEPIAVDTPNLGGFVDPSAERGESYTYELVVEAISADGRRWLSSPTGVRLDVSAELVAVDDLTMVQSSQPGGTFDLTWTAPKAGRVRIYRLPESPPGGIDHTVEPLGALTSMGLDEERRLVHPLEPADPETGLSAMLGVPWPSSWRRVFCTPVTELQGHIIIGATVSTAGVDAIEQPTLVERVNGQVLRFAWPTGAASVNVHIVRPGTPAETVVSTQPAKSVEAAMHRRLGGIPLRLPAGGCRVVLVPTVFDGGKVIQGSPSWVDYSGLRRLRYSVERVKQFGFINRSGRLRLRIWEEGEPRGQQGTAPGFVLVHNPDRLPLLVKDGTAVPVSLDEDGSEASTRFRPQTLTLAEGMPQFRADLRGIKGGFVRLFVSEHRDALDGIALLDPAVDTLRVS